MLEAPVGQGGSLRTRGRWRLGLSPTLLLQIGRCDLPSSCTGQPQVTDAARDGEVVMQDRQRHWDEAYRTRGSAGVSWFQAEPTMSLELINSMDVESTRPVIDIGGGASLLVDHLVARGFAAIEVLDLSKTALEEARARIGSDTQVRWTHQDVLTWEPTRRYGLWHDRAVFHFLTDESDQQRYAEILATSIEPNGVVIIATFAKDGPEFCSGLPVARYSGDELLGALGLSFKEVRVTREVHVTPAGAVQPFTWVAARTR